jgi:predicted  nucleic acid-binding Zn-ribbon protein
MAEELVELGKIQVQLREVVKGKDQQYAGKVGDVGGKLNDLRAKVAGFEGQVKELETKRAEVAKGVHPPLLSRYETVRKRRMPALVTVVAGTCQGCNMSVPPQLYNTLKTTLETDICPSCHRIICAPEAIEPPPAKKG